MRGNAENSTVNQRVLVWQFRFGALLAEFMGKVRLKTVRVGRGAFLAFTQRITLSSLHSWPRYLLPVLFIVSSVESLVEFFCSWALVRYS